MLKEQMEKEEDVYLTPEEALQWGFIDEVFDGNWDKLLKAYPKVRE
jgi:ATP-dependent protease ClpP protease subunit